MLKFIDLYIFLMNDFVEKSKFGEIREHSPNGVKFAWKILFDISFHSLLGQFSGFSKTRIHPYFFPKIIFLSKLSGG